jgi:hypothetical protein
MTPKIVQGLLNIKFNNVKGRSILKKYNVGKNRIISFMII